MNRVQSTDFEAGGVVTVRSRYQRRAISVFVKFKSKCLACLFCCPVLYEKQKGDNPLPVTKLEHTTQEPSAFLTALEVSSPSCSF